LEVLANHPRTRSLRAAALAQNVTIPTEDDSSSAILTAMEANAAGAVVAAARREFEEATSRLSENAAIAELALATPSRHWSETGLRMLHSLVVLPLAEIARLRGDREGALKLSAAATSIAESIDRFGSSWIVGAIGLASDPRDLGLLDRLKRDSTIPLGFRVGAVEGTTESVCLNPREWLTGADPVRSSAFDREPTLPDAFRVYGIRAVIGRIEYCVGLS
jgi:hypothetical protein